MVLVLKTNFLLLAGKTLGWIPPEEWTPNLVARVLQQADQDAAVRPGGVVLLGDSLIAQLDAAQVSEDASNFAIGGDTTRTLTARLPVLRSVPQARAVVVGVGVNDLKYRDADTISDDYLKLLDRLADARQLFVLSVLPIDPAGAAARERPYLRNATIAALNRQVRAVCDARPHCRFIDAWPAMQHARAAEIYGSDGWHLSPAGNRLLAGVLRDGLRPPAGGP